MDAGAFDRRITLERKGVASDDGFQTVDGAWDEVATIWARFIPLSGSERAVASQTQAFCKANWEIRKDSSWADLNAKDRLTNNGKVFNILNVTEPRRGFMFIESIGAADS